MAEHRLHEPHEEKHMLQELKELNQLKAGVAEYQAAREAEEKQRSSEGGINELIKAKTKESSRSRTRLRSA